MFGLDQSDLQIPSWNEKNNKDLQIQKIQTWDKAM